MNQPRDPLPSDTVSIYSDGSAVLRKLGQPPPPAGHDFKAVKHGVTGGNGREHVGGSELYEECGQIKAISSQEHRRFSSPRASYPSWWANVPARSAPAAVYFTAYAGDVCSLFPRQGQGVLPSERRERATIT